MHPSRQLFSAGNSPGTAWSPALLVRKGRIQFGVSIGRGRGVWASGVQERTEGKAWVCHHPRQGATEAQHAGI